MQALVVYESMFGNTALVAEAIAEGLGARVGVRAVPVADAPTPLPADIDLVVVGGPTHAFGMSRRGTRSAAARQDEKAAAGERGVREWLAVAGPMHGTLAASFDTHARTRLPGSASGAIRRRLRRSGARVIAPPRSFYVTGTQGPLDDGERDRARAWGAALADAMAATVSRAG